MSDQKPLAGKGAIVTGAGAGEERASSIGDATARALAQLGAHVAVVDILEDAAANTVRRIEGEGGRAFAVVADLGTEAGCARAVAETRRRAGGVSVLVNNVAVSIGTDLVSLTEEYWDRVMSVNLKSVFFLCKHALPLMQAGGGGSIVNISSTAAAFPSRSAAYGASKGAMESLTRFIAVHHGPQGVRCNAIRPGEVWTAMAERAWTAKPEAGQALREDRRMRSALLSEGAAEDIAEMAAFLATPRARWITGQVITVDGGSGVLRPSPDWQAHYGPPPSQG